eukprot:5660472-Lingulodinium_polyedra.AAC.1
MRRLCREGGRGLPSADDGPSSAGPARRVARPPQGRRAAGTEVAASQGVEAEGPSTPRPEAGGHARQGKRLRQFSCHRCRRAP